MKKTITSISLLLITFISTSAFVLKYSTGIAGYTGSPGETSCSAPGCHSGGTSATSGITITATPSFTNDEYVPGTTYTIAVTASAAGFTHYGFGCEILNDGNTNIGTMQLISGSGVKFLTAGSRKDAVHTTPKTGSSVTFSFKWVAPAEGEGNMSIYAAANAVNLNNSTSGDFPITPVSMLIGEGAVPINVGLQDLGKTTGYDLSVYPNPTNGASTISYSLKETETIVIELIDISGKRVKELLNEKQNPGDHSQVLNFQSVPAGVYFIRTSAEGLPVSQKLITVQ